MLRKKKLGQSQMWTEINVTLKATIKQNKISTFTGIFSHIFY